MPVARFQMPDGRIGRFEVPEGTTPEQAQAMIAAQIQQKPPAPQDPSAIAAEGVGIPEALLIGAGRTTDKIIQGAKQLYNRNDPVKSAELAAQEAEKDAGYSGLQKARPIATAVGEGLPYMAVPASAGILPASLAVGAAEGMKYGTDSERAGRAAMGAGSTAVGGMIGKAIGKSLSPIAEESMLPGQVEALKSATKIGYKPRLSEVTGSQWAAGLEDFAAATPGGSGVMKDFARANTKAVNRAAASSMGESASSLTPQVFANAEKRLGGVFNEIKALPGKTIGIDAEVGKTADDILRAQAKQLPEFQESALVSIAEKAKTLAANKGKIDGETYQLLRSDLSSAAWNAEGANKTQWGKLLEAVDNSAERSLKATGNEKLAEALRTVRPEYANFKTLTKGAVAEGGNATPGRIAQSLRNGRGVDFRTGDMAGNPLYDVAMIGESLKPLSPGSPTYSRMVNSSLLDTALKAPLAFAAAKATTSPIINTPLKMLATGPQGVREGAAITGQVANPSIRALVAALLQHSFPTTPVVAEK